MLKKILIIFTFVSLAILPVVVLASSTDGTIDSTYRYAYGENIGWIDFGTTNGNVHVTDSGLSGYALSENTGWINLDNVVNDGEGNLSGYGWSENTGWINFAPTNGGVIINSSGEFTGSALSENVGWIIFTGDYKVKTDWRPRSARPACNNSTDDDGDGKIDYSADPGCSSLDDASETDPVATAPGGGGPPLGAMSAPTPAAVAKFQVLINNNDLEVQSREVILNLWGGSTIAYVWLSEKPDFPESYRVDYNSSQSFISSPFTLSSGEGVKTVYAKFCTQYGYCSEVVSDSIIYTLPAPVVQEPLPEIPTAPATPPVKPMPAPVVIAPTPKPATPFIPLPTQPIPAVPEILAPTITSTPVLTPVPTSTPALTKEAPPALRAEWDLWPKIENQFAEPTELAKQIDILEQKFPKLKKTFQALELSAETTSQRLNDIKLYLSGLQEILAVSLPDLAAVSIKKAPALPLVDLAAEMLEKIPTEVVFAQTAQGKIDLPARLQVDPQGKFSQEIKTLAGKHLRLNIRPEGKASAVRGFIVFRSQKTVEVSSVVAVLLGVKPALAQETPAVEKKLVLGEFEYTDPDGDGLYTADILAPVVAGKYDIITVINYENQTVKKVEFIAVVDPEGYIYKITGRDETRLAGVEVALYWFNPETKSYQLWPAKDFGQQNPQITDNTGRYSFLVPPGRYYLAAQAGGYSSYQGDPFEVALDSGVHLNIELQPKFWWLKFVDWRTVLLFAVAVFLFYNFYKDKKRDKNLKKN